MPDAPLFRSTIRRARGELPQVPLVNLFLEQAVTEPRQFSLLSFPGLTEQGTEMGDGPVTALFQKDGVLNGELIGVSAGSLYTGSTLRGSLGGSLTPSIAGNEMGAVAAAGANARFWDGSTLTTVDFPDGAGVRKVAEQAGRFVFLRSGSQKFYWSEVLEDMLVGGVLTVDGLNFASAESEPDQLLDVVAFENTLALGGTKTIEFWTQTGDAELPWVPISGRTFQKGVRATGCMSLFDNTVAWISNENIVYRAGNVPDRISDPGIEELIARSETCRLDSYFFEGHEFLKVGLDSVTIELDAQTGAWTERRTGIGPFLGGPVVSGPVFGSTEDGNVLAFSDGHADFGGVHERSFCVFVPINSGGYSVDNLMLRTNPGHTDFLAGPYANPTVEMIQSYDGGFTFDAALPESLGEAGHYRREVEWRALGMADAPGFFAKFRVTDPVSFRVSGVSYNEAQGGRSR